MEWIFANKDPDSKTDASFSHLVQAQHEAMAATGGLRGLKALNATTTGYANMAGELEVNAGLEAAPHETESALRELTEVYGKDTLAEMKPNELYKLYKMHATMSKRS